MMVNLASLLIPYYEVSASEKGKPEKEDGRIQRSLTIAEFLPAFGKYKALCANHYLTDGKHCVSMKQTLLT